MSRDKHKLEVMTSADAFFFPSKILLVDIHSVLLDYEEINGGQDVVDTTFCAEEGTLQGRHTSSHPQPRLDEETEILQNWLHIRG